jgi:putative Mg2+ transporter-C (MgtC) family protein
MTGIGFLGAGAILKARLTVTGLTSAATIWFVAAVGLTIGWGEYLLALSGTMFVLLTLNILGRFQHIVGGRHRRHILVFRYPYASHRMQQVKRLFTHVGIYIDDISISRDQDVVNVEIEYVAEEKKHQRLVAAVQSMDELQIVVEY